MIDLEVSYEIQKFYLKLDTTITERSFSTFIDNYVLIGKLLTKKKYFYSLFPSNYKIDDCFSTTTGTKGIHPIYVENRELNDVGNINDIELLLAHNKITQTTFNRLNKILDLSYLHDQPDDAFNNFYIKLSDLNLKIVNSILIDENKMQLITLSNMDGEIVFDENFSNIAQTITYKTPVTEYDTTTLMFSYDKPFIGTQSLLYYIKFNPNILFDYRFMKNIYFTPNLSGQYKIRIKSNSNYGQGVNFSHTEYPSKYHWVLVYPDIDNNPTSVMSSAVAITGRPDKNYAYLTEGKRVCLKVIGNTCNVVDKTKHEAMLSVEYASELENINLTECSVLFEDTNGTPITTYDYNNVTYNIEDVQNKIFVQVLNVYTQLVLFNTTGITFEDHEKFAINKYCLIQFDFVNSIYPTLHLSVKKSLEIRE